MFNANDSYAIKAYEYWFFMIGGYTWFIYCYKFFGYSSVDCNTCLMLIMARSQKSAILVFYGLCLMHLIL